MNHEILILGAGPAGMSCAMELCKASKNFIIVEKNNYVGGLAATLTFKENNENWKTDIGPHRFFTKKKYIYDFVKSILELNEVKRFSSIYNQDKFFKYPLELQDVFFKLNPNKQFSIIFDYCKEKIKNKIKNKKPKNFEEYTVSNFGKKLSELFILNYTNKIWGIPCNQISPDWATQRIGQLNLWIALKNILFKNKNNPKTLTDSFHYPEYGIGTIYEKIQKKIEADNKIFFNSYPVNIKHNNKKIKSAVIRKNKKNIEIFPKSIISSIPITEFVKLLNPKPPKKILDALKNLKYRSQVYLFLSINKSSITENHWIYFPDKDIPFGRISEMKNFSEKMSPKNKTSLFVEFFCFKNDKIWNMDKNKLFDIAMKNLERLGILNKKDIIGYNTFKQTHAYPIYTLDYKKNLEIVKHWLDKFENLQFIGRQGRFRYNNQDHSIEMGIFSARNLLEGKDYDLENIGSENEYFEK